MGIEIIGAQTHAFRAKEAHGAQVALFQIVFANDIFLRLVKRLLIERHFHSQYMSRAK